MNYSPTIMWGYEKFKNIISSTNNSKTEVLQFGYADVLLVFYKFCNFSISIIFYNLAPRCQMGDFGRQISQ